MEIECVVQMSVHDGGGASQTCTITPREAQRALVGVTHTLKQMVCAKGYVVSADGGACEKCRAPCFAIARQKARQEDG